MFGKHQQPAASCDAKDCPRCGKLQLTRKSDEVISNDLDDLVKQTIAGLPSGSTPVEQPQELHHLKCEELLE